MVGRGIFDGLCDVGMESAMTVGGETVVSDSLATLADARARKAPWAEIAEALRRLESSGLSDPSGRTWAQIAADLSAYAETQLRRMTTVLTFVRSIASRTTIGTADRLKTLPLAHLDVLMRLSAYSEEEAITILNSIGRDGRLPMTYRMLLDVLDRTREQSSRPPSPRVAGKRSAREFQDRCFALLGACPVLEVGPDDRLVRRSHDHPYANPDFYIVRRGDPEVVEGIDCYALQGSSQRDLVVKRALHTAIESTFFDRFWVVLSAHHASDFESECRQLGLANVGLIVVDDQASRVVSSSKLPAPTPFPDRRLLWRRTARQERL